MAAVIDLHTGELLAPSVAPRRPALRLIEGGRGASPSSRPAPVPAAEPTTAPHVTARTYLLRRIAVGVAAAVLVLVVAQVLAAGGRMLTGAFDGAPAASGRVHVVEAGETAWQLAGELAPSVDRRSAVDDLLALNGQGPLRVGQRLRLPASFG